jgi:hypothetical protein
MILYLPNDRKDLFGFHASSYHTEKTREMAGRARKLRMMEAVSGKTWQDQYHQRNTWGSLLFLALLLEEQGNVKKSIHFQREANLPGNYREKERKRGMVWELLVSSREMLMFLLLSSAFSGKAGRCWHAGIRSGFCKEHRGI